jgi:redox-sensitive bicupin YhaK (pirin superfamily)
VITVQRGAERYRSVQPGIVSRHCFSAGAHYDPANLRFGALIALDEHVLDPGAGFAEHAHRGVELVSWVLAGVLRHEDGSGRVELVGPGQLQQQISGAGIRHSECNASASEPLRFVQAWLALPAGKHVARYRLGRPPLAGLAAQVSVIRPDRAVGEHVPVPGWAVGFVTRGEIELGRRTVLRPGDSVRLRGDTVHVRGSGEVLVVAGPPVASASACGT